MKRAETTNTFNNGLVMDIHPLVAPNDSMCNALNATLITFNGNENALQCDMGNGRVETAYLPEGYVPVGTTELGGIVYIVSYNPLTDKCQIGSFPSPERNITSDEVGIAGVILQNSDFINSNNEITNLVVKRQLSNFTLNPGDKFLVSGSNLESTNLSCFNNNGILEHNYLKLSIATIDSNGRTVYLKDLIKRPYKEGKYINIHSGTVSTSETVDSYRDKVGCNYDIFNSKIAGNLYLIAELEVVDTFTVNWELVKLTDTTYSIDFHFNTTSSNGVTLSKIYTNELNTIAGARSFTISIFSDNTIFGLEFPITESPSITFTPCMPFGICKWLETTINIDSSLLGTGKILNDVWQYYKEPSQMILSYNLDCYLGTKQSIEYVRHYFVPCVDVEGVPLENIYKNLDKYFYYELPKRKAYSGHYNNNITFQSGFEENSLYLVVTTIKKITEDAAEFSYLLHWLYTNGVFNQEYIKQTSNNFDLISLPLEYKVTSNPNMEGIVEKYTKEESKYLYSTAPTGTIKGKTILEVSNNKVDLNLKLGFQNNYDSFEVDQISLEATDIKTYLSYTANQLNTGSSNVNTDYVKIVQNVDKDGLVLGDSSNSDYFVTSVNSGGESLKITGKFYNPIAANSVKRNVKVENYYAPVLHTTEDLSKYGLSIDDRGKFQMETTFVGLGMSNGGTDNQGGGGVRHVNGIVDLGMANNKLQQVSAVVQTGTDDSGNSGYDRFPDQDFSNYVNDVMGGRVIIPVLLVNAGTKSFTLKNGTKLQFSEVDNRPKESGKRVAWFKDAQESSYRYLWIFIKTSNETIITYSPLNDFFKITNLDLTGPKSNINTSPEFKLADILGSFLSQLFVKRTSQELPRYTVKDISYFDNLIEHVTIKGNINTRTMDDGIPTISKIAKTKIKINEIYLDDLSGTYPAPCLTYKDLDVSNVKLDIVCNIPVKNLLLDTYLECQSGALGITDYVYNPREDATSEIPINKDDNAIFYTYGSNQAYIEPIGPDFFCYMVSKVIENSTGILSISQGSSGHWFYNIKKLFTFNNRTQELVLNNSAYNKEKIFYGRWGSHQNESDGNWTAWKDISVFKKQAAIWVT